MHFRQWAKKEWLRFYILHSTFLDFTFRTTYYILHLRLRVFVETTFYILHIRFRAGHLHSSSTFAGRRSKPSCIYIQHLESQQHAGKFIYILHSRPGLHTPGFGCALLCTIIPGLAPRDLSRDGIRRAGGHPPAAVDLRCIFKMHVCKNFKFAISACWF